MIRSGDSRMAVCPECEADIEIDEYDVDKGEIISCPECGVELEVVGLAPLRARRRPAGRGGLGRVSAIASLEAKRAALERVLDGMGSVLVAYSGRRRQRLPRGLRAPRARAARARRDRRLGVALGRAARAGARRGAPLRLRAPRRAHARAAEPALRPQRTRTAATTARASCSATSCRWPGSRASRTSPTA